jgi:hypothetical protein
VSPIHTQYEPNAHSSRRIREFLFLFFVHATVLATLGSGQPVAPPATRTANSDDLSSYAYCPYTAGPSIVSVDRFPGNGIRYRTVETSGGPRKISMIDGYRIMLAYPGRIDFANMHVEKSDASQYPADKDAVIKSMETLVAPSGAPMVAEHRIYNGFDMYASNDPTMTGNGPSGMYVLFRDSAHLIVTIYFLDQKPEDRQYKTLADYTTLRDGVLKDFTTCANEADLRAASGIRPAKLLSGNNLLIDAFDSVSHWHTNPSAGVDISIHPDSGRHGRGMRVDFDFHGHGGYGIVNRKVDLDLPENYEFAFALRGTAPTNTLEFKLVDPTFANVWWSNHPNFIFTPEWKTIARKKREICFAWGPIGSGEIHRVAAIELAITAGSGGKGSIWIDDLSLVAIDPDSPFDIRAPSIGAPIVGTWESTTMQDGGVGATLDFAPDGAFSMTFGAKTAFAYSVSDGRLITTFKNPQTGQNDVHTTPISIQHDSLIQKEESGTQVTMKRLRPAPSSDESIVGVWSYRDNTGITGFVDFAQNGQGVLRLPMSSCSGTWSVSNGTRLTASLNGQPPAQWDYSIENAVLTMKNAQGVELKYNRRNPRD